MNKKGELSDILVWLITIFILAVGLFIFSLVPNTIFNSLENSALNINQTSGVISQFSNSFSGLMNNGFLMLFSGLILSMFITAFLVRTHPIFLFLYIFFLIISLIVAFYLGNLYYTIENNSAFADIKDDNNFINLIMHYIAEITLAVGAITMIIIFAKFSTYGGTQPF